MQTHAKLHEWETKQQVDSSCSNQTCGNLVSVKFPNAMKMCTKCYREFYSPRYDPDNQMIKKKMMLRNHTQMTVGCKLEYCVNTYCASSSNDDIPNQGLPPNDSALKAVELVKLSHLYKSNPIFYFCCPDSISAKRRVLAEQIKLALDNKVGIEMCLKSLIENNENADRALIWASSTIV